MTPLFVVGCLLWMLAQAQTVPPPPPPSPPPQAPVSPNAPEMNTREETSTSFQSHVNLVMVPVVARDAQGTAVGNLTKANFLLFDKGKPQEISRFSVEKVGSKAIPASSSTPGTPLSSEEEKGRTVVIPERFVAFLFDDVHLAATDLPRIRDAAERHIATLQPSDRAAIYTMSGNPALDFTDDQDRLRDGIRPAPARYHDARGGHERRTGRRRPDAHPQYPERHQGHGAAHGQRAGAAHPHDDLSRLHDYGSASISRTRTTFWTSPSATT